MMSAPSSRSALLRRRSGSISLTEQLEERLLLTDFVVNTTNDVVNPNDGFLSLREALGAANNNAVFADAPAGEATGDTITFDPGLDGETITLNSELTISDDVEIFFAASEIILDANFNNFGILNITTTEEVVLTNMDLVGSRAQRRGGALLLGADGNLTLNNVDFFNNRSHDGGAILMLARAKLTGVNLDFEDNQALGGGGDTNNGGAIVVGTAGELTLSNSNFTNNTAARDGGAIDTKNRTRTDLDNVFVTGGSADRRGGGISFGTLSHNTATFLNINNSTAPDGGGLVVGYQAKAFLEQANINNNDANGTGNRGSGGGIFAGYESDIYLFATFVEDNEATRGGGGIEIRGNSKFKMEFSFVSTNDVSNAGSLPTSNPGQGGGIRFFDSGTNAFIFDSIIANNVVQSEGGGVWSDADNFVTLDRSDIDNNTASGEDPTNGGGGLFNNGGFMFVIGSSSVSDNVADGTLGSGGGILSTGGEIQVRGDVTIARNTARRAGGGIEIIDGTAIISGATIGGDNSGNGNRTEGGIGNGGGVHVSGDAEVLIKGGTTIENNFAALEGGGLWNSATGEMIIQERVRILNNVAAGNGVDQGGGGLFNDGGFLSINDGSIIAGNQATGNNGRGGGILSTGGRTEVYYGSSIENNTANGSNGTGGGVAITNGTFVMGNSLIITNSAGLDGGGIHVSGTNGTLTRLTNRSRIISNTASRHGGGLWTNSGSNAIVERDSLFDFNSAGSNGGAIYNNAGTVSVSGGNTLLSRSFAGLDGGAIFNAANGTLNVTDARITRNQAGRDGGGIFTGGITNLNGASIFRNVASFGGGVFINLSGTLNDNGAFIFDNTPDDVLQET